MDAQKTHFADDETLKHIDRLQAINAELVAALEQFANMDTVDLGRASLNNVRDDFMFDCPEFIGFCKQARAALSKAKES